MATRTDHARLDVEHRIRLEIAARLGKYVRRMREEAYAIGRASLDAATGVIDTDRIALEAIGEVERRYLGGTAQPAIESRSPDVAIEEQLPVL